MSNQGQGLINHFCLGFVCCVLTRGPDIRCAFTGPLVLWLVKRIQSALGNNTNYILFVLVLAYKTTNMKAVRIMTL